MAEGHRDTSAGGGAIASLPEFRRGLLAAARPVEPVALAPDAAVGAVLAEDLVADRPHPPQAIALRAGFALASIETVGASPYGPVAPARLVAVAADEPLPAGCDAVIPADAIVHDLGLPMVQDLVAPGIGVLRAGAELEAGTVLAEAGHRLDPLAAEAARLLDRESLAVRRPRLALHHDGSPGGAAAAALLAAFAGPRVSIAGVAPIAAFGTLPADLHLAIGIGDLDAADPAIALLAERGRLAARGATVLPCEAVAWGTFGEAPALVLPGRFDEIAAAALMLVEPLLDRLTGATPATSEIPVRLARKIVSQVGFAEVAYLAPTADGRWDPVAVGRAPWTALARALAWIEFSPESEGLAEGADVLARPLGSTGLFPHGDRT